MRLSALAIDVAQLLSITEIALPQTFLCVDRSSIQYDFHGGANALWRSAEMPTSGDLKSGDCLFFTTPRNFNTPPPPRKIDPAPNGNDLRHYMMSYVMYIPSKFEIIVLMLEIIFVTIND